MSYLLRFLFIAAIFITHSNSYAQPKALAGKARIDSLLAELPKQKEDSNKVKVLSGLSFGYRNINPDEGIKYGQQELALANKLNLKKSIATANNGLGLNYQHKSDYIKALEYYFTALKINEETGSKKGAARVMGNIGVVYKIQNNTQKALEYFFKALKIYEENEDKTGFANTNENIGNVYKNQGDYAKALEYHSKALKIYEETGNKGGLVTVEVNIGTLYIKQKNYQLAIENYSRALAVAEAAGNKYQACVVYCNIGAAYVTIIADTSHPSVASGETRTGKYQHAGLIPQGRAAILRKGIDNLQKGLAIAIDIHAQEAMQECYENLSLAYQLTGDYKHALEYADNFRAIKDSLFSKENNEKIMKIGLKNEYERQRLSDSLKTAEREDIATLQLQRQRTYTLMGIAGILLLAGFSFFIVKERGKSETERKKSDGLLLNILPAEVANELKANGTTTAKHFEEVTVLFTDFINFTHAGERMNPQALIDELHTCFKAFDEITSKHNIEKIKTIGDAYLAVCGLPAADPKHAENVVKAAKEINAFMVDRHAKLGDRTFAVRIGIHSGSVVAGIVGVKKFAYDIWGDTVNTAARMEQNSEAGKINISQTTYDLVKDKFTCEYRGEIEAKGKGVMKMYYLS